MTEWNCFEAGWPIWIGQGLRVALDPSRGLVQAELLPERLVLPQLLGVEIVDAKGLGPRPLFEEGASPEVVCRQDIALAVYRPTAARPVECHARWRVHAERVFDLEVSTLTPGLWGGLSVRTCSLLPDGEVLSLDDAPVVVHRVGNVSYVEMCHPNDTIGFETGPGGAHRFRLFGHDLEKGVILRGRLRGMLADRRHDLHQARQAFQQFLREPPHLSA